MWKIVWVMFVMTKGGHLLCMSVRKSTRKAPTWLKMCILQLTSIMDSRCARHGKMNAHLKCSDLVARIDINRTFGYRCWICRVRGDRACCERVIFALTIRRVDWFTQSPFILNANTRESPYKYPNRQVCEHDVVSLSITTLIYFWVLNKIKLMEGWYWHEGKYTCLYQRENYDALVLY